MPHPRPSGPRPRALLLHLACAGGPFLAAAALAPTAIARPQISFAADPSSSWQGLYGTEEGLTDAFAADLDQDGRLELVLRTDTRRLVWNASFSERQHRRVLTVDGYAATIDDVALQLDGPGGGDALLTANPNGVHQWALDPVTGELQPAAVRAVPGGHARVTCAGEVAGVYRAAYALRADERTVDPMLFHASTGAELFPLLAWDLGAEAGPVAAVDLDGDGLAELAAVTATSLVVHDLAGGQVAHVPRASGAPPSADALVVLQDAGSAADQLAWVSREGAGWRLRVLSSTGLGGAHELGSTGVLRLSSADLDGDGLADLLIVPAVGPRVRVLRAVANVAPRFELSGPDDVELLPDDGFVPEGPLACAGVAAADFDRDGDLDVALAARTSGDEGASVSLWRGLEQDHARLHPALRGGDVVKSTQTSGLYEVTLDLDAPPDPVAAQVMRWRIWAQFQTEARLRDAEPALTGELPAPTSWPASLELELAAELEWQANWTVDVVLVDASGGVEELHPALLVAASAEGIELVLGHAEPGFELWGWLGGGSGTVGEGGVGDVPRVPPPPVTPDPDEPETPLP
jgi:hypothetical protein